VEVLFEVRHKQTGINFDNYEKIAVEIVPKDVQPAATFDDFEVVPELKANLMRCGYTNPTPVQKFGIPVTFKGKDIMACAQTGSGKTAAFLIPMINHVLVKGVSLPMKRCIMPIGVVMAPTRELAAQIYDEGRKLCFKTDAVCAVVYGGTDYSQQFNGLEYGADILVATPGRLKDLFDRHRVAFERVKFLVLDEADRMLDMGFEEQIEYLVAGSTTDMPGNDGRQTMLYSATFPKPIQNLARSYLKKDFYLLTVGRVGSTTKNITQRVVWCDDREKRGLMMKLLCTQLQTDLVLIFVEKKANANSLFDYLNSEDIPCATIHGDRKQFEREAALAAFKCGETPVLVATDVAARGLDIPNVAHVIQYDLPSSMDDYIHRIGRTGRAGNSGVATAFFNDNNRQIAGELHAYLTEHEQECPDWLEQIAVDSLSGVGRRGGGGGGGAGGRRGGGPKSVAPSGPPSRGPISTGPPSAGPPNLSRGGNAPLAEDWEALMSSEMGGGAPKKQGARRANAAAGSANDGGF
jgi:ATP-dependent RNA helicase DDX3X